MVRYTYSAVRQEIVLAISSLIGHDYSVIMPKQEDNSNHYIMGTLKCWLLSQGEG